jgi:hypothetical protein
MWALRLLVLSVLGFVTQIGLAAYTSAQSLHHKNFYVLSHKHNFHSFTILFSAVFTYCIGTRSLKLESVILGFYPEDAILIFSVQFLERYFAIGGTVRHIEIQRSTFPHKNLPLISSTVFSRVPDWFAYKI